MSSPRQGEANRVNAERSTGPRTAQGKARVARNAVRHGLSIPLAAGDSPPGLLEALAKLLRPDDAFGRHARAAALAQAELMRVQTVKLHILQLAARGPEAEAEAGAGAREPARADAIAARALIEHADALLKLDVYERKARSRRKTAFRALCDDFGETNPILARMR